jgi:hypothetical protein
MHESIHIQHLEKREGEELSSIDSSIILKIWEYGVMMEVSVIQCFAQDPLKKIIHSEILDSCMCRNDRKHKTTLSSMV